MLLGKSLFEPSPHSNKASYRIFRGVLGVFTLAMGLLLFMLLLPLVVLEMITSGMKSVRMVDQYALPVKEVCDEKHTTSCPT